MQHGCNVLPSAVTPGSTTNTVVLAIIRVLSSSSSETEEGAAREPGLVEQGEAAQRKAREVAATLEEVFPTTILTLCHACDNLIEILNQVKRREKAREQERRHVVAELANRVNGLEYQVWS